VRIYEDLRAIQSRTGRAQYVVLSLMALLLVHFWHLQVVRGREFRRLADSNRTRLVTLAAPRGLLLDREGQVLVENRAAFNIVLVPEHSDEVDRIIARLARVLGIGEAQIRERLARRPGRYLPVVVKAEADFSDVAVVEARRRELPGVSVEVVPLRSYRLEAAAAHTLGRVGEVTQAQLRLAEFDGFRAGELVGQAGIEARYNRRLMGRKGHRKVIVNSRDVEVAEAEYVPPRDGPSLQLTLDARLQTVMEHAMEGHVGGAVALDPQTGEILAMVSRPAFDPNGFSSGLDRAAWRRLTSDPDTPLVHRVIQGQYAPGSLFKLVMAVAGLEEGVISAETALRCGGALALYDTVFHCNISGGHGRTNLRSAIGQSCNVYFYRLGVELKIERIAHYARQLGLGAPTGVDLPHEKGGLVPDPEWKRREQGSAWYPGETVSVAIGQGQVTATPLQMARLAAAIANGGRLVTPHLVRMPDDNGAGPAAKELALRPGTLAALRKGMETTVTHGTGWRAALPGIRVAGKTGSAQVVARPRTGPRENTPRRFLAHGWFLAFAPVDDPKIALVVLVEHGGSGGEAAAPVARRILAEFFGRPSVKPGPRLARWTAPGGPLARRP